MWRSLFHLRALVWLAVAAVLTEEDEQVSSRVASACSCPVMVIKKPRDDAGAFLTVLPRRVFIHIDGTFEANEAFEWAAKHLLAPELDEVFLLTSSKYKAGGGWLGLGRGQRISQQGRDAERMAIDSIADAFQDECIRQGYNASKVPVGWASSHQPPSCHDLIRTAELKSCDLLVVGKTFGVKHEDTALWAAHNAPFPVIVVGDSAQPPSLETAPPTVRPHSAPVRSNSAPVRSNTDSKRGAEKAERRLTSKAESRSRNETRGDKSADVGGTVPRSSSLERLLNSLAETEVSCVTSSRRAQVEQEEYGGEATRRRLLAVDEDPTGARCAVSQSPPRSPGGGMRRVATRCSILKPQSDSCTKRHDLDGAPRACKDSRETATQESVEGHGCDARETDSPAQAMHLGEPWMREAGHPLSGHADGRTAIAS